MSGQPGTPTPGVRGLSAPAAGGLLFLAALLLFTRAPGRLLAPELWAEDGTHWVAQAYSGGAWSLFWPLVGYLQTLSRITGLIGVMLPFTAIPLFFALVAFVVQLAPVALLLSRRGAALLPSLAARLLLAGYYVGVPNSWEVHLNLTNAMWHLALVALLLVMLPPPRPRWGLALDAAVLVLAGLSGPLVLAIAPIAGWQALARRGQADGLVRLGQAAVLGLCALVQASLILAQAGQDADRAGRLGASLNRLLHILADQIVLAGTVGDGNVRALLSQSWWLHTLPAALVCLAAGLLGVIGFIKGPAAHRQLTVLAALTAAGALISPRISVTLPQWALMQVPGIGGRYFLIPMLAWFTTLLVLSGSAWGWAGHWLARALLCACLIGVVSDWRYKSYVATGYQQAAQTFDAAPAGTIVTFPENPVPWKFTLTKR